MQTMRFAARHALASAVVVAGIVGVTGVCYFGLLVWAALTGQGLGGPLALPFLILFALIAGVLSAGLILLPTTTFTEWVCVGRRLPAAMQIPISIASMGVYVVGAGLLIARARGGSTNAALMKAGMVFLLLLVPLGAYWWSLQSFDWVLRRLDGWRRRKPLLGGGA